jgi:hypothetical protein
MSKRDGVEAALIVIGVYGVLSGIQGLVSTLCFWADSWSAAGGEAPNAWLMLAPSVLSLLLGVALAALAAPLARRLVSAADATPAPPPASASTHPLQLGLQLVGIFVCLMALPEVPRAIGAGFSNESAMHFGERPIDQVTGFLTRWHEALSSLLMASLGLFVALRAAALAARLSARPTDPKGPSASAARDSTTQGTSRA